MLVLNMLSTVLPRPLRFLHAVIYGGLSKKMCGMAILADDEQDHSLTAAYSEPVWGCNQSSVSSFNLGHNEVLV